MFGLRLKLELFEEQVDWITERPVEKGKILFYGDSFFAHSSFTYRRRKPENPKPILEEAVRMKDGSQAIINHGFGGSATDQLLYYYDRLVRPYQPRALFLHVGSNDLSYGYSVAETMDRIGLLVDWFRKDFPEAPIYLMNRTPAPGSLASDKRIKGNREEYNRLIEWLCAQREGVKLIKLNELPFLFENPADIGNYEKVREDLHDPDQKHLNRCGYEMLMDWYRDYMEKEGLLEKSEELL